MESETGQPDFRVLLLRNFIWDIFPHDNDIVKGVQQQLGLVPSADDGLDVEHDQSDMRINRAAPLEVAIRNLSVLASHVIGVHMIYCLEVKAGHEVEVPEGFLDGFSKQNKEIIYGGTHAIICHLLDTGALTLGKPARQP
jgi:hypothetical protein